jgi:hypothetical protein
VPCEHIDHETRRAVPPASRPRPARWTKMINLG